MRILGRLSMCLAACVIFLNPAGANAVPAHVPTVIGGSAVSIDTSPWQVFIVLRGTSQCSGALVSPTMVVTAAHCLASYSPSDVRVWAGISKTSERSSAQELPVAATIAHPSFDVRTFSNDIGVITLAKPVDITGKVYPIALPFGLTPNTWPANGTAATITGWGVTAATNATTSDQPIRADVTVLAGPLEPCGQYGPDLDPTQHVCAGSPVGAVDACQGDSGGPLVVRDSVPILAGLVSSGNECAKAGYPGLYTRVTSFLPWLQQQGSIATAIPPAPTDLLANNLGSRVDVTWKAPITTGSTSTIWKVTAAPSGQTCTTTSTLCEFDQLPSGQTLSFSIIGANALGAGPSTILTAPFVAMAKTRKLGSQVTAKRIASWAGVTLKANVKITSSTPSVCVVKNGFVVMKRRGSCIVTFTKTKPDHSVTIAVV